MIALHSLGRPTLTTAQLQAIGYYLGDFQTVRIAQRPSGLHVQTRSPGSHWNGYRSSWTNQDWQPYGTPAQRRRWEERAMTAINDGTIRTVTLNTR